MGGDVKKGNVCVCDISLLVFNSPPSSRVRIVSVSIIGNGQEGRQKREGVTERRLIQSVNSTHLFSLLCWLAAHSGDGEF